MQVGIAELKARLSEHLRAVRKGRTVTVLDRDTPVARIVPYATADDQAAHVNVIRVLPVLDIERLQYVLTHDRKQVFEEGMILDARQKDPFWVVYHRFEKEKEQLDAKRLRLLGTYIEKFPTLTNGEALKIMKQSGQNQQAELGLRQKYFTILSKKINPVIAARFAQLDDIVGMTIRLAG